jgi:hypothetical protein
MVGFGFSNRRNSDRTTSKSELKLIRTFPYAALVVPVENVAQT